MYAHEIKKNKGEPIPNNTAENTDKNLFSFKVRFLFNSRDAVTIFVKAIRLRIAAKRQEVLDHLP